MMSGPLTREALDAMDTAEVARRLAGPPADRAAFIAAAAEAGLAEAQAVLGQMLLDGAAVPHDPPAGFRWFRRAAEQGHVGALNMLGRCYDQGWGVAVDKPAAAHCFAQAAARGLDWGLYNYATALALGDGVAEDRPQALALFRKAAAMGNAKALNYVGSFHEDGWVVVRDMAEAARCYAGAAEGGDFRGMFNHSRMLIAAGEIQSALGWIARLAETATPAFLAKSADWLSRCVDPRLRDAGARLMGGTS
jgi:TPR repeat protein